LQDAIRRPFDIKYDRTGNLPSMPGIFPDYSAPVICIAEGVRVNRVKKSSGAR
jgi:hypothetical protein